MSRIALIFLTCLSLFLAKDLYAEERFLLKMAFNDTVSFPWKWKENGRYIGPFIDVMQEVAERSELRVEMVPLPWKRALMETERGVVDGFFGGYKTQEREQYAEFLSIPIGWATLTVFVRKGEAFNFNSVKDLRGKIVGIIRGYTTSELFDQEVEDKNIQITKTGSYINLIRMLAAGRMDCIVGSSASLKAHISDMKLNNKIHMLPTPVTDPKPIYICISRKSKIPGREKVFAKMNHALKEMKREKSFEKISKKYGYDKCVIFGCPKN